MADLTKRESPEKEQRIWLLEFDPDDTTNYQRIVTGYLTSCAEPINFCFNGNSYFQSVNGQMTNVKSTDIFNALSVQIKYIMDMHFRVLNHAPIGKKRGKLLN